MNTDNTYLRFITPETASALEKPVDANIMYFSNFNGAYIENIFRNFSIKYCLSGQMHYQINKRNIEVPQDHFFIANKQPGGVGYAYPNEPGKRLCIDINQKTVNEAWLVYTMGNPDFDNILCGQFSEPIFFENVYRSSHNVLGGWVRKLVSRISTDPNASREINEEVFLHIIELVMSQEIGMKTSLSHLRQIKTSTREETLRRLLRAKDYINDNFLNNPSIKVIAQHCMMGEFHFYRYFRDAFGQSPYQFILEKRLEYSKTLLDSDELKMHDLALTCGFVDMFTFSKAFKRKYGLAPSHFKLHAL